MSVNATYSHISRQLVSVISFNLEWNGTLLNPTESLGKEYASKIAKALAAQLVTEDMIAAKDTFCIGLKKRARREDVKVGFQQIIEQIWKDKYPGKGKYFILRL